MPETIHSALIEEQKKTKPNIEDVIGDFLEGDALRNAMDFVAFLRENNMNPRWSSANAWRVTGKKSKPICKINLGGAKGAWMSHMGIGDWQIIELEGLERKYLDEFISCDELKAFIWANVHTCTRCSSCGPRKNTYAGKQFDECCGLKIVNPNVTELEFAKKLVEANKRHIYANA